MENANEVYSEELLRGRYKNYGMLRRTRIKYHLKCKENDISPDQTELMQKFSIQIKRDHGIHLDYGVNDRALQLLSDEKFYGNPKFDNERAVVLGMIKDTQLKKRWGNRKIGTKGICGSLVSDMFNYKITGEEPSKKTKKTRILFKTKTEIEGIAIALDLSAENFNEVSEINRVKSVANKLKHLINQLHGAKGAKVIELSPEDVELIYITNHTTCRNKEMEQLEEQINKEIYDYRGKEGMIKRRMQLKEMKEFSKLISDGNFNLNALEDQALWLMINQSENTLSQIIPIVRDMVLSKRDYITGKYLTERGVTKSMIQNVIEVVKFGEVLEKPKTLNADFSEEDINNLNLVYKIATRTANTTTDIYKVRCAFHAMRQLNPAWNYEAANNQEY